MPLLTFNFAFTHYFFIMSKNSLGERQSCRSRSALLSYLRIFTRKHRANIASQYLLFIKSKKIVELQGFEPWTPALQRQRSTN